MKAILNLLFLLNSFLVLAQKNLAVIKSNTENVKIIESNEIVTHWTLDPNTKPDIYICGKIAKSKNVKFITDIDSLEINLQPNQKFDFIILLNGKDSCYTRFESPKSVNYKKIKPVLHDTIHFKLTDFNNISVQAVLNKKDTLSLLFDTGAIDFYLTKEAIKKFLNPNGAQLTMKDIADNYFEIENLFWENQQIYPIETTGQENDGMFGWNAFDGKILEIDYDRKIMLVHSKLPKMSSDYEKFQMELMKEHFCIFLDSEVNGKKYKNRYLFDTGFQKAIILDDEILKDNNLQSENFVLLNETKMINSQKQEIPFKTVLIDKLYVGKYILSKIPSQINSYNQPAGFKTNFLGNDILKRFNAIIDFQTNVVYLKPNNLYDEKYFEVGKKI